MDHQNSTHPSIPTAATGMDYSEELIAEVDEPPDERKNRPVRAPPKPQPHTSFIKADPAIFQRRESLLTRQLHSENEQTDEEDATRVSPRTLSTQSTWSNPSVASTAELTSDDGQSVASPAISPPLPPTAVTCAIPITEKPLTKEPTIVGQEDKLAETGSEKSVEAGLGRKRCISFACGGNKDKRLPPTSAPKDTSKPVESSVAAPTSPPKRKCMLKFVCPTKDAAPKRPALSRTASGRRFASPPPSERRSSKRGSDSTVTYASPKNVRKSPPVTTNTPAFTANTTRTHSHRKQSDDDSDRSTEATRFHEFASSDGEPEEWVQESGCYRSRLTVTDTLKKENILRRACEEVEEEVIEEEEDEEELADADVEADDDDLEEDNDDDDDDIGEDEESDDGFRTDDEEGFADSDSEGEDSDEDWWTPGGASTAATSIDHQDLFTRAKSNTAAPASSVGSASSGHLSPRTLHKKVHRKSHVNGMPIQLQTEPVDLPDSTDFVCGTLDEDRPLEQAFINHRKQREAAKHKARPQDIDPTFPTSDPEMDEEDDEDLEDPEESDREDNLMHGNLEDLDGDNTLRRKPSHRGRSGSNVNRSPPPLRRRSPAPGVLKRVTTARSPPPPVRHRSPAPGALKRVATARSPPPPVRRTTARSPSRKLFAESSSRGNSPMKVNKMTSPPNTRRASPTFFNAYNVANVLASRPDITRTASLPRGGGFHLGKLNGFRLHDDGEDSDTANHAQACDVHKRGAIDIYKGLEKKRQRRKEKLHQKMCAKAAAKGEKNYRVKPGKGAERMREIGLEIQRYRGKGEHILSM